MRGHIMGSHLSHIFECLVQNLVLVLCVCERNKERDRARARARIERARACARARARVRERERESKCVCKRETIVVRCVLFYVWNCGTKHPYVHTHEFALLHTYAHVYRKDIE